MFQTRILGISLISAVVALTAAAAAMASANDAVLTTVQRETKVDAYHGRLVWSAWDPADQSYHLMESTGKAGSQGKAVPIDPSNAAFDVDLGPGPQGGTVAVYSRCERPPLTPGAIDGSYNCHLYAYDFAKRREFKVPRIRSMYDQHDPAVWGTEIAYLNSGISEGDRTETIIRRPFTAAGPNRALPYGTVGFPQDLDMRSGHVAFIVPGEFGGGSVRFDNSSRRTRLLAAIPSSGGAAQSYDVFGTSIEPRYVYWMVSEPGEGATPGQIRRYVLRSGEEEVATDTFSAYADAFSQDGTVGYYAAPQSSSGCPAQGDCLHDIHRLTGLTYGTAGPLTLY